MFTKVLGPTTHSPVPAPCDSFSLEHIGKIDYTKSTPLKPSRAGLAPQPALPASSVPAEERRTDMEAVESVEQAAEVARAPVSRPSLDIPHPDRRGEPYHLPTRSPSREELAR